MTIPCRKAAKAASLDSGNHHDSIRCLLLTPYHGLAKNMVRLTGLSPGIRKTHFAGPISFCQYKAI